jgi:YVTN family beta-propeller protein
MSARGRRNLAWTGILVLAAAGGCGGGGSGGGNTDAGTDAGGPPVARAVQPHSSVIAADPIARRLYVLHPDADSVTVIDRATRQIVHEVLLASALPARDASGRYAPAVGPRALALDSTGQTLYVTGQWSGSIYAIDTASGTVARSAAVCSEPIGVLVSADDASAFVACAQDDEVVELRTSDLAVVSSVPCLRKPWTLAWAGDGRTLLATHLLGPGVSSFATGPLAAGPTSTLADGPPGDDATEPHGVVRGLYDALVRPGTSELWIAHLMLGIDTPQPTLDFQRTVFPALSILSLSGGSGTQVDRLSVHVMPGDGGAFGDVVSGPRALAFSDDGGLAFVADTDSEDLLVVDATARVEAQIVRPLPGHLPEGVLWVGGELYVYERNSEEIAAFTVTRTAAGVTVTADGPPFPSLAAADPMPAVLRQGQQLFYSANSDELPLTQNHWVACASCHLEGRSDAVTWKFAQGPRDTPSNAGGLLDTGFLFRTADRTQVQDYWRTINVEQGGHFSATDPSQKALLDALAEYVNYAIPVPVPPSTDASHTLQGQPLADLRAQGAAVFQQIGCATCHDGPARTDSGADNPALDLAGPVVSSPTAGGVLLHDVGTCVGSGDAPDVDHTDIDGHARAACAFDTPALRGLADAAPYLHDGSAATLDDVVPIMLRAVAAPGQPPPTLSAADQRALVEYLRGL